MRAVTGRHQHGGRRRQTGRPDTGRDRRIVVAAIPRDPHIARVDDSWVEVIQIYAPPETKTLLTINAHAARGRLDTWREPSE